MGSHADTLTDAICSLNGSVGVQISEVKKLHDQARQSRFCLRTGTGAASQAPFERRRRHGADTVLLLALLLRGAMGCQMVPNGARWCQVVPRGARWCQVVLGCKTQVEGSGEELNQRCQPSLTSLVPGSQWPCRT